MNLSKITVFILTIVVFLYYGIVQLLLVSEGFYFLIFIPYSNSVLFLPWTLSILLLLIYIVLITLNESNLEENEEND